MRTKMFVIFVQLAVVGAMLAACAAPVPTPVVVKETVIVAGTPQVVEKTVIVAGTPQVQVVEKTVVAPATPAARPKLRMWIDHTFFSVATDAMWKAQALQYAAQEGFDLEYQQDVNDVMFPKEDAALESKTFPDVFYSSIDRCARPVRAKQALDVTDLVAELNQNMGGIAPGLLAATRSADGKNYMVPFALISEYLYVRQDQLDKAGMKFPDTWEDLLAFGLKVNDPANKMWGWAVQLGPSYDAERELNSMLADYGASLFSKDGKSVALDSPETRQVLELIKKAWDAGIEPQDVLTGDDSWNNTKYLSGQVATVRNTGSIAKTLAASNADLMEKTALGKPLAGPKGRFMTTNGYCFVIASYTKYPDLAKGLVKYLSAPEQYKPFMNEMQGFRAPGYVSLDDLPMWKNPVLKPAYDTLQYAIFPGYPGPATDAANEAFTQQLLAKMVGRMLGDKWTADQAIAETVTKANDILQKYPTP